MKVIVLTEEGKIIQTNSRENLTAIVKKYISSNYQIRHPSKFPLPLPFSIILICSPLKATKKVNPLVPILFPEIKSSIKGDVVICKEGINSFNHYSFLPFTDEEVEKIRIYFLESLTKLKAELDKEREMYQSMRKESLKDGEQERIEQA